MEKDGNLLRISRGRQLQATQKRHENAEDGTNNLSVLTLY